MEGEGEKEAGLEIQLKAILESKDTQSVAPGTLGKVGQKLIIFSLYSYSMNTIIKPM